MLGIPACRDSILFCRILTGRAFGSATRVEPIFAPTTEPPRPAPKPVVRRGSRVGIFCIQPLADISNPPFWRLETPTRLALAELEPATRALLTVLLAFLHTRVPGQKSVLAQRRTQLRVQLGEGARNAHAHRSRLAADAAALDLC